MTVLPMTLCHLQQSLEALCTSSAHLAENDHCSAEKSVVSCWANKSNQNVEGCSVCKRETGTLLGREGEKDLSLSISKLLNQLSCSWNGNLLKFAFKAVLIVNSSLCRPISNNFECIQDIKAFKIIWLAFAPETVSVKNYSFCVLAAKCHQLPCFGQCCFSSARAY